MWSAISRPHDAACLVGLVAATSLIIVTGCQRESNTIATTGSGHNESPRTIQMSQGWYYLVPCLDDSRVAVVCSREECGDWESTVLDHPVGVPFNRRNARTEEDASRIEPSPPDIAIWSDRTIIWAKESKRGYRTYWIGQVETSQYDELVTFIESQRDYSDGHRAHRVSVAPTASECFSTIAVVTPRDKYVLISDLDQMERENTYWYWNDGRLVKIPMNEHSFDDFCATLVPTQARHLRRYADFRTILRSLIPSEGRQIDAEGTLSWVVQRGVAFGG